jgi:hypothetical protein
MSMSRTELTFASGQDSCAAWFYPGIDHFDIYDGPAHEAVVADEVEFLSRYLLGRKLCGETKAGSELRRVYLPAR